MGRAADLLVAGDAGAASELAEALRMLGLSAVSCPFDMLERRAAEMRADGVVTLGPAPAPELPPGCVRIAVDADDDARADAVLRGPAHPIQIAARMRALLRLRVLERTARLRGRDLRAFGADPAPVSTAETPASVLYVGEPGPVFMSLSHALSARGGELVGAFSTFNAFDYLHERAFDAVALNAAPTPETAHTVCSAMRRNTRLYHTPAVILTPQEFYPEADEAFARGASDILPADTGEAEIGRRLLGLAAERRRRRDAKALLDACRVTRVLDDATDLFSERFARSHAASLLEEAARTGAALSVVALEAGAPETAGPSDGPRAMRALTEFASMLRHCVRAEDLSARMGRDRFCLILPATSAHEAEVVADRVRAIAECTAYESEDPLNPFRMEIRHAAVEANADEAGDALLARAFDALPARERRREAV